MKSKKPLLILILPLLLIGCGQTISWNENSASILSSISEQSSFSSSESSSSNKSSSSKESSYSSYSSISSYSSSSNSSSNEQGTTLPIGNTVVSGPSVSTVDDITEWKNYSLLNSLPSNFSFIVGNNKKNSCNDFYAESAGGGFKFAQKYYGFQTGFFNTWKKVEVRLKISKVANNSQKVEQNKPILHIYGYNKNGEYIQMETIEQGKITAQTEGSEIKLYIRNQDVSYLEFRLNAFPYKGTQCYNFGVSQLSLKGWNYD